MDLAHVLVGTAGDNGTGTQRLLRRRIDPERIGDINQPRNEHPKAIYKPMEKKVRGDDRKYGRCRRYVAQYT